MKLLEHLQLNSRLSRRGSITLTSMICLIWYFKYGTNNTLVAIAIEQSFTDVRLRYTKSFHGTKHTYNVEIIGSKGRLIET